MYNNDKWKTPSLLINTRRNYKQTLQDDLHQILIEARSENVKEVLLKIDVDVNYDKNSKAITLGEVKDLYDTLEFLRSIENINTGLLVKDILKHGIIYEIISIISRIFPYNCSGCENMIFFADGISTLTCAGCGVGACHPFNPNHGPNQVHICPNCSEYLQNQRTVPNEFLKAKA